MRFRLIFLLIMFLGFSGVGLAQSTRDVKSPEPPAPKYQSVKKQKKGFFLFRMFQKKEKKKNGDAVTAFRADVEDRLEQKAKDARKYDKPQFTDPLYFGHKKPPKKRKVGKKKFCKECGIVH